MNTFAEKLLIVETVITGEKKKVRLGFCLPYWSATKEKSYCHVDWDWLTDDVCRLTSFPACGVGDDSYDALADALDICPTLSFLSDEYIFYTSAGDLFFSDESPVDSVTEYENPQTVDNKTNNQKNSEC